MASKNKSKTKGLGSDPSLGKMGQRMINAMLREERIAERDLQEKLKAISEKEHKAMVKLGCDSLDVRHDLNLHRTGSPLPWENTLDSKGDTGSGESLSRPKLGRKAMSMLTFSRKQENIVHATDLRRTNSEEVNNNKTAPKSPTIVVNRHNKDPSKVNQCEVDAPSKMKNLTLIDSSGEGSGSSSLRSPRLLQRRPVSDISTYSASQAASSNDDDEVFVEQIALRKGLSSDKQFTPKAPSTPPPVRRNLNSLSADARKPRPSSARSIRSPDRGVEGQRLDLPHNLKPRSRSPSPSPVRLSADTSMVSLGRRGSAPPKIDASVLPTTSPLRRALGTNDVCRRSHEDLRRHISSTEEDLQDRVSVFLKTLQKK